MPTLAQAETVLVGPAPAAGAGLVGAVLARVGFAATGESPVASLAPAIMTALIACGITPADVIAPDDDDLARLAKADWPKFLDIAALSLLEAAALAGTGAGPGGGLKSIQFEDYRKEVFGPGGSDDLLALLAARREAARRLWGYGSSRMRAGSFTIGSPPDCPEF